MSLSSIELLTQHFAQAFRGGAAYDSITQARQEAAIALNRSVQPGTALAKQVEEALEAGLVLAARQLVQDVEPLVAFDSLVKLYEHQPNLATRSSTSIRN